jgi:chemotaxis protein MotB
MGTAIDKVGSKASDPRDTPMGNSGRVGDRDVSRAAAGDREVSRPVASMQANQSAAASIRQALQNMPEFAEVSRNILIEATKEGVNVSLMDQDGRSMFPEGSVHPYERTRRVLEALTPTLRRLQNRLSVTGHTAAARSG